jgi:hypothetical protein
MNMLEKLTTEIRQGGTLDLRKLAIKLDTTPQMVAAMLDHLRQSGFLGTYETCGDACGGCGLRGSCSPSKSDKHPHLWQYTQPD